MEKARTNIHVFGIVGMRLIVWKTETKRER